MARSRRQFSREFKVEAVRLASAGDRSVAEVARELGVNAEVLRSWKRQLAERDVSAGDRAGDRGRLGHGYRGRDLRRTWCLLRHRPIRSGHRERQAMAVLNPDWIRDNTQLRESERSWWIVRHRCT